MSSTGRGLEQSSKIRQCDGVGASCDVLTLRQLSDTSRSVCQMCGTMLTEVSLLLASMALKRRGRDSNPRCSLTRTRHFQCRTIDHSVTSPSPRATKSTGRSTQAIVLDRSTGGSIMPPRCRSENHGTHPVAGRGSLGLDSSMRDGIPELIGQGLAVLLAADRPPASRFCSSNVFCEAVKKASHSVRFWARIAAICFSSESIFGKCVPWIL